jgi:hypothetical protein
METSSHITSTYAALRFGGASQTRAQAELAITPARSRELESLFQVRRPGKGGDMRPRFSRDAQHVRAVQSAGGYPALCR